MSTSRAHLIAGLLLVVAGPAGAWGPHTEITRAALAVLPDRARVQKLLGNDWDRLARDYCWMGDWREAVRPDHYADDYLLFPAMAAHVSHMLPEVRRAYAPFFRRALQAVRTETPQNAARWAGSLLHFVQDSGSPPHTTGIGGQLHAKMERWVDESKIHIDGYRPRRLGRTDDEALRGFLERVDGLVAFARARSIKLRPLVEGLGERVNQPLELECALETARVSADVVHTLFALGLEGTARPGCTLAGRIDGPPPDGYARVPAKVVLAGAPYSTTTDAEGRFHFRNLPAGKYDVWFLATGYETECKKGIELTAGREARLDVRLKPDRVTGNLVRNPSFRLSWVSPPRPDGWGPDPLRRGRWAGALLRVPLDRKCLVRVEFQPGEGAAVAIRWRSDPSSAGGGREVALTTKGGGKNHVTAEVAPDTLLKPFEKGVLFLEVLIETTKPLPEVCRHVSVGFADR